MTANEPYQDQPPPQRVAVGLSFGDGFQFGCGFFAASLVATLVIALLALLVGLGLSLAGFGVLQGLFGS